MCYELSDYEWSVIKPMLPNSHAAFPVDDLPENYGLHTTCYNRKVRWRRAGVWDRIMDALAALMMRRCK